MGNMNNLASFFDSSFTSSTGSLWGSSAGGDGGHDSSLFYSYSGNDHRHCHDDGMGTKTNGEEGPGLSQGVTVPVPGRLMLQLTNPPLSDQAMNIQLQYASWPRVFWPSQPPKRRYMKANHPRTHTAGDCHAQPPLTVAGP